MADPSPIEARRQLVPLAKTARGRTPPHKDVLKHGLNIRSVIAFDENSQEFEDFYREIASALRAKDSLEELLVERIAICGWRLRRIYRIESGLFSKARTAWKNGVASITQDIELVFLRLASHDDDLRKLSRYETSLERSLLQTLHELLKNRRRPSKSS